MDNIKKMLLSQYGYTEYEVTIAIKDIENLDNETKDKLHSFLNGENISDYYYKDFSVKSLIEEYDLNPISALITISSLKNDYDNLSRMLKKGFK